MSGPLFAQRVQADLHVPTACPVLDSTIGYCSLNLLRVDGMAEPSKVPATNPAIHAAREDGCSREQSAHVHSNEFTDLTHRSLPLPRSLSTRRQAGADTSGNCGRWLTARTSRM